MRGGLGRRFRLLRVVHDELEQSIGQRVAHSIPLDHQRDVMPPVGAQLLERLPERRRRKHLVTGDEPDLK